MLQYGCWSLHGFCRVAKPLESKEPVLDSCGTFRGIFKQGLLSGRLWAVPTSRQLGAEGEWEASCCSGPHREGLGFSGFALGFSGV